MRPSSSGRLASKKNGLALVYQLCKQPSTKAMAGPPRGEFGFREKHETRIAGGKSGMTHLGVVTASSKMGMLIRWESSECGSCRSMLQTPRFCHEPRQKARELIRVSWLTTAVTAIPIPIPRLIQRRRQIQIPFTAFQLPRLIPRPQARTLSILHHSRILRLLWQGSRC